VFGRYASPSQLAGIVQVALAPFSCLAPSACSSMYFRRVLVASPITSTDALFLGALREKAAAPLLYVLFSTGLVCTLGALGLFLVEMLIASRGLRRESLRRE
jgi:hypothetical protein